MGYYLDRDPVAQISGLYLKEVIFNILRSGWQVEAFTNWTEAGAWLDS